MSIRKKMVLSMSILLGLSLVGCGSNKNEEKAEDLKDAAKVESATIEAYVPKGKNTDYLMKAMELYNKEFDTDLKLKTVDVAPNVPMVQKVTPKLVSNEKMPELMFIEDGVAGSILEKFSGSFYSSEDFGFIKDHGDDFYEAKLNMLKNITKDKKIYGFPNDWGNAVMYYNDDAFKKSGVEIKDVQDWDELIEAGKKLKETTGKNLLFMNIGGEIDLVNYITQQQGISMFDEKGNLNFTQPEVVNAYNIIKKIKDADIVSYGPAVDYTKIGQECGVILQGGWLASYQGNDYPDDKGKWRIAEIVKYEKDAESLAPMSGGSSYYVAKNSENATAALQFISYALTNQEALASYMEFKGFPANKTAYELPIAQEGDDYYGGQAFRQVINAAGENSIKGYVYPYTNDFVDFISEASVAIDKGEDIEKVLNETANEFAEKHNIEVNK